jgi:hypothetical protein
LQRRVSFMQGSLDRADAVLAQLKSATLGAVPLVTKPSAQTITAEAPTIVPGGVTE